MRNGTKTQKRTKIRMKESTEGRRKRKRDKEHLFLTDISHSNAASLPTVISASISAKEEKFEVFQIGCKAQLDGSAYAHTATSELW